MRLPFVLSLGLAAPAVADTGPCGLFEAVEPADTFARIATRCETTVAALEQANPGQDPLRLEIGSVLRVGGPRERGAVPDAPMARYLAEFAGDYSPSFTCFGQELQLTLAPDRVFIGEMGCDLARVSALDERLFLDLVDCNAEGVPTPDRTYEVSALPGGELQIAGRQFLGQFERCTDR